jgi:hypothetical protein
MGLLLSALSLRLALLLGLIFLVIEFIIDRFIITLRRAAIGTTQFLLLAVMFELGWGHDLVSRGTSLGHAFSELNGQAAMICNSWIGGFAT